MGGTTIHLAVRTLLPSQKNIDGLDDRRASIGLAVDDQLVNAFSNSRQVDGRLLSEAIVPTAVPNAEKVRVFLIRSGKLRASQLPHVDVTIRIGIGLQFGLGLSRAQRCCARKQQDAKASFFIIEFSFVIQQALSAGW